MTPSETSALANPLVRGFESCRLNAYPDPASGGAPWTIGWGQTGPGIGPGTVWTQAEADAALVTELDNLTAEIAKLVTVSIPDQSAAALVSFAYNDGIEALATSTLLRELNAGETQEAADQFGRWIWAAHKINDGLVTRREKERHIFLAGYGLAPDPAVC